MLFVKLKDPTNMSAAPLTPVKILLLQLRALANKYREASKTTKDLSSVKTLVEHKGTLEEAILYVNLIQEHGGYEAAKRKLASVEMQSKLQFS